MPDPGDTKSRTPWGAPDLQGVWSIATQIAMRAAHKPMVCLMHQRMGLCPDFTGRGRDRSKAQSPISVLRQSG